MIGTKILEAIVQVVAEKTIGSRRTAEAITDSDWTATSQTGNYSKRSNAGLQVQMPQTDAVFQNEPGARGAGGRVYLKCYTSPVDESQRDKSLIFFSNLHCRELWD